MGRSSWERGYRLSGAALGGLDELKGHGDDAKMLAQRQPFQLLVRYMSKTAGEDLARQVQTRLDALRQATLTIGDEAEDFSKVVASEFSTLIDALEP